MSKRLAVIPLLIGLVALSALASVVHAQSVVTMTAAEFAFTPATVRSASGTVSINLRNDGQFPHNIQFDGQDAPIFTDSLTSGQSATATVNLAPGVGRRARVRRSRWS